MWTRAARRRSAIRGCAALLAIVVCGGALEPLALAGQYDTTRMHIKAVRPCVTVTVRRRLDRLGRVPRTLLASARLMILRDRRRASRLPALRSALRGLDRRRRSLSTGLDRSAAGLRRAMNIFADRSVASLSDSATLG